MEIIDIKPRGYCKGVIRAIILAKKARETHPQTPIHILGSLVHNHYIVEALKKRNIMTVNDPLKSRLQLLDEIQDGIVIFSAHGVSDKVRQSAHEKGLQVLDATCEDVSSTHDLIQDAINAGTQVIYVGKDKHPEALAVTETFDQIHFITSIQDVNLLHLDVNKPIMVTNQTTLSTLEIQQILQAIVEKYPHADVNNEICFATRSRQEAIIKQQDLDALIVVGDPTSNNTAMLAKIGANHGIQHIFKIESLHQLDVSQLNNDWRIGITSGASTPNYLTNMVVNYMRELNLANPHPFPPIEYDRILD